MDLVRRLFFILILNINYKQLTNNNSIFFIITTIHELHLATIKFDLPLFKLPLIYRYYKNKYNSNFKVIFYI